MTIDSSSQVQAQHHTSQQTLQTYSDSFHDIRAVESRHKRASALITHCQHMQEPAQTASRLLSRITNSPDKFRTRANRCLDQELPNRETQRTCQRIVALSVARHVNSAYKNNLPTEQMQVRSAVLSELLNNKNDGAKSFAHANMGKIVKYIDLALQEAHRRRSNQHKTPARNLYGKIENAVVRHQHLAFLKAISWDQVKEDVRTFLKDDLMNRHDHHPKHEAYRLYAQANPNITSALVDEALHRIGPLYSLHRDGARFKSLKSTNRMLLEATQIRTISGNVYELINTPTQKQAQHIAHQHNIKINVNGRDKGILGEGSYGKLRYARNTETGEIVAVKKFVSHNHAKIEAKEFSSVNKNGENKRFVRLLDTAHVRVQNKKTGTFDEKSYLFLPLANKGDGVHAAESIASIRITDAKQAEAKLLFIAKEYAGAVAEFHRQGLYHHDVKLENFLHSEKSTKINGTTTRAETILIADYGLASDRRDARKQLYDGTWHNQVGGTWGYFGPEGRSGPKYQGDKHDAFSLGITLLELKHYKKSYEIRGNHLTLTNGFEITLDFIDNQCIGLEYVEKLRADSYDNIVAKLLHCNPDKRMSAEQAFEALKALEASSSAI